MPVLGQVMYSLSLSVLLLAWAQIGGANEIFQEFDFTHKEIQRDAVNEEMTAADQYEACRVAVNSNLGDNDDDDDPEFFDVAAVRPSETAKSVIAEQGKTWDGAQIPTKLQDGMTNEQALRLSCAIKYFEAFTCIKFIKYEENQADYLYITKTDPRKGCFSEHIGRAGGRQILNLDSTSEHCWMHGTIVHELMHVLGFFHEQARNDRDDNVVVHWDNIPDQYEYQFKTAEELGIEQSLVLQYDYASIMHYGRFIWHLSNPTMTAKKPADVQYEFNNMMGQRARPTDLDTQKLITVYCPEPEGIHFFYFGIQKIIMRLRSKWLADRNKLLQTQTLTRQILREGIATGAPCPSLTKEVECNTHKCPIDCEMSDWQQDGECSATCGVGVQQLSRVVTREPENGGKECPSLTSVIQCNLRLCTRDCIIENIADTPCSVTCGQGTFFRLRRVVQEASEGGQPCPEELSLTLTCTGPVEECPDAEQRSVPTSKDCVSEITSLTPCSVSCGGGTQTKESRVVKKEGPGGKPCPPLSETLECNVELCGVDCSFGWVEAEPCSKTCDSGVKTLKPTIYKESEGNGKACPAADETQVVDCNLGPCQKNNKTSVPPVSTKIMLIGGESRDKEMIDSYEFYNPNNPSENSKKSTSSFIGRRGHTAAVLGDKVLVFSGLNSAKRRRKRQLDRGGGDFYYYGGGGGGRADNIDFDDFGGGGVSRFGEDDNDWGGWLGGGDDNSGVGKVANTAKSGGGGRATDAAKDNKGGGGRGSKVADTAKETNAKAKVADDDWSLWGGGKSSGWGSFWSGAEEEEAANSGGLLDGLLGIEATTETPVQDTAGPFYEYKVDNGQHSGQYYEPHTDQWSEAPTSNFGHINGAGAVISGAFFICGGTMLDQNNKLQPHRYCEYLTAGGTKWALIPQMEYKRQEHAAAAVFDKLYMIGGTAGAGVSLDVVEKYNPNRNAWYTVKSMSQARTGAAAAALNDLLYVCGGKQPQKNLNDCEVYDPPQNEWKPIATMLAVRANFEMVQFGETLMVLGNTDRVDIYDPQKDKWTTAKTKTIEERTRFAAVVL